MALREFVEGCSVVQANKKLELDFIYLLSIVLASRLAWHLASPRLLPSLAFGIAFCSGPKHEGKPTYLVVRVGLIVGVAVITFCLLMFILRFLDWQHVRSLYLSVWTSSLLTDHHHLQASLLARVKAGAVDSPEPLLDLMEMQEFSPSRATQYQKVEVSSMIAPWILRRRNWQFRQRGLFRIDLLIARAELFAVKCLSCTSCHTHILFAWAVSAILLVWMEVCVNTNDHVSVE